MTNTDITQTTSQCQPAISLDCYVSSIVAIREADAHRESERLAISDRIQSLGHSVAAEIRRLDLTRFEAQGIIADIGIRAREISRGIAVARPDDDAAAVLASIIRDGEGQHGGEKHIVSLFDGCVTTAWGDRPNVAPRKAVTK